VDGGVLREICDLLSPLKQVIIRGSTRYAAHFSHPGKTAKQSQASKSDISAS